MSLQTYDKLTPEFAAALIKVQGTIEGAKKDTANPFFKTKYADLGACWDACREALQANNIGVLQFPTSAASGYVGLTTVLIYGPTGEVVGERFEMPLKNASDPQAAGSAITYARRYALCSVIGICPEDDDGEAASGHTDQPKAKTKAKVSVDTMKFITDMTAKFKACLDGKDLEGMKDLYLKLKTSSVQEPQKTTLLTEWGGKIKELKGPKTNG